MKDLLVKYWKYIIAALAVVFMLFLANRIYTSISERKTNELNVSNIRSYLVDSIAKSNLLNDNNAIEATKLEERKKIVIAEQKAERYRKRGDILQLKYNSQKIKSDSVLAVYRINTTKDNCENVIVSFSDQIDSLEKINVELTGENIELDKEAEGYSRMLFDTEKQNTNLQKIIISQTEVIENQNKELIKRKKPDGFIKRSAKWIFGVAGMTIGILASK